MPHEAMKPAEPCTGTTGDPTRAADLPAPISTGPRPGPGLLRFGSTEIAPAERAARPGDMDPAIAVPGPAVRGRAAFGRMGPDRRVLLRANLTAAEPRDIPGAAQIDRENAADVVNAADPDFLEGTDRAARRFH